MARRRCQYCKHALSRWAKVLHIYTCAHCAYRMSMGTTPARPAEGAANGKGGGAR